MFAFESLADNRDKFLENDRQKIESVKPRIKRLKLLYINTRIKYFIWRYTRLYIAKTFNKTE